MGYKLLNNLPGIVTVNKIYYVLFVFVLLFLQNHPSHSCVSFCSSFFCQCQKCRSFYTVDYINYARRAEDFLNTLVWLVSFNFLYKASVYFNFIRQNFWVNLDGQLFFCLYVSIFFCFKHGLLFICE